MAFLLLSWNNPGFLSRSDGRRAGSYRLDLVARQW